ncbi:hypothetical protein EXIGLDRAFT_779546, partial [Exidia glandulosa HHB12029]
MRPRLLAFAKDVSLGVASQGAVVHCLARASRDDSLACCIVSLAYHRRSPVTVVSRIGFS